MQNIFKWVGPYLMASRLSNPPLPVPRRPALSPSKVRVGVGVLSPFPFRWLSKTVLSAAVVCSLASPSVKAGFFYDDGTTTMHFAFEGSPNGDWPIVRAPGFYHADDGFGFVDSPTLRGVNTSVTAPKYFRFDVNLPDGNYDVGVTLGGAQNSVTTVKAEAHRPMLLNVRSGVRDSVEQVFTVNVCNGGVRPTDSSTSMDMDGRLNLEFVGTNPSLMKLDIMPNTTATTVYLVGDTKVCDHDDIPAAGWGQMLPILFKPGEIAVSNQASSRGDVDFLKSRLDAISRTLKTGDYLFIEFDNNARYDRPGVAEEWKGFIQTYLDVARQHHATAVLVTPAPSRSFDSQGKLMYLSLCAQWMREIAAAQKVPLIDLNAAAMAFLQKLGPDASASAFAIYPAGTLAGHPEAMADDNDLNPYGAFEMAKLVAQGIKDQKLGLAAHLTGNAATNLDPAKFPANLGFDYLLKSK